MTDIAALPKTCTWDGELIESLSHAKLCQIICELVERADEDRRELHRHRLNAIWVIPEGARTP